jgi:hypothetical protein
MKNYHIPLTKIPPVLISWTTGIQLSKQENALRMLRQNCKFKVSLGYIARPCLKKTKHEKTLRKQRNKKPGK